MVLPPMDEKVWQIPITLWTHGRQMQEFDKAVTETVYILGNKYPQPLTVFIAAWQVGPVRSLRYFVHIHCYIFKGFPHYNHTDYIVHMLSSAASFSHCWWWGEIKEVATFWSRALFSASKFFVNIIHFYLFLNSYVYHTYAHTYLHNPRVLIHIKSHTPHTQIKVPGAY